MTIKTNSPLVSVVLFRYFCRFGLLHHYCSSFIRRSQGSTHRFRPFSSRRQFVSRKSMRLEIFLATVKALWSLHPPKCLFFENPRALRWKWAFSTANSLIASFCGTLWYCDWSWPLKRLEPNVKFRATQGGTVNQCTLPTPSPEWIIALLHNLSRSTNGRAKWRDRR